MRLCHCNSPQSAHSTSAYCYPLVFVAHYFPSTIHTEQASLSLIVNSCCILQEISALNYLHFLNCYDQLHIFQFNDFQIWSLKLRDYQDLTCNFLCFIFSFLASCESSLFNLAFFSTHFLPKSCGSKFGVNSCSKYLSAEKCH